ncbi:cysteine synthase K/M:Cysteine synthase B [Drechmeria coniospora]|uniref:Cysteine synthase K/M:Cysteine synthase B n=1 Tax=Drechmeria coniospora TaxID=98403 RepID=A0A151GSK3_DRECN|nr:cysteine synthase K/M:Cysteine synthase B [Drechmeria coniospora]KYK60051.1 cysteine synthase K/M:Cysteine synthase B [Drechmeria coniospora]
MAKENHLNVFRGPDSVRNYFDPDSSPPLPLVEIPDSLNPYRRDGVRIYAKMIVVPGKTKTIVEYSSGSTALSMSLVGRAFYGMTDIRAFLSNKTSLAKIRLMQVFGLNLTLFGGAVPPEPLDERGPIRIAKRMAEGSESVLNPNQYDNDDNWKAHVKWTGPQILRQLPEINLICSGIGTSGTLTGLGSFFKEAKPSVFRLGVCTTPGNYVPGPRSYNQIDLMKFPWRSSVDDIEQVSSRESYALSLALIRAGLLCGPSSGHNLQGLFQFVEKRKADGSLRQLAGPDGEMHCAFICCDLPYQYIDEYFQTLGDDYFPPVTNKELLGVDKYSYDPKWEMKASDALHDYFGVDQTIMADLLRLAPTLAAAGGSELDRLLQRRPDTVILDFRQAADFDRFRLPGSVNIPFVGPETNNPFSDAKVLRDLWLRLEDTFKSPNEFLQALIRGKRLLLLCYDGDSARVATSVLRANGFEADSVMGGFKALNEMRMETGATLPTQISLEDTLRYETQRRVTIPVGKVGSASG